MKGQGAFLVLLCSLLALAACQKRDYTGYTVVETVPWNGYQLTYLQALVENVKCDFWTLPTVEDRPVHILIAPEDVSSLHASLDSADLSMTTLVGDVQSELLRNDSPRTADVRLDYDWDNYNNLSVIYNELNNLMDDCPSGFECSIYSIGQSYEGREMNVLKLSKDEPGRKAFFLNSHIHAREWIAGATNMKILNRLVRERHLPDSARLTDGYDWYFLPVLNVDGYEYTWTTDRFWRKTRSPNDENPDCPGTDLNRNYDINWTYAGSSTDPCSQVYRGKEAASEIETKNVQAEAVRLDGQLMGWLNIHSYGQLWLTSWAYKNPDQTCDFVENYDNLQRVANVTAKASSETHNTAWVYGDICSRGSGLPGFEIDYVTRNAGVKYAFLPELRGPYFDPPPADIEPSFNEVWNGLVAMVDEITVIEGQ